MDYFALAQELSRIRRRMARIPDFRKFITPDDGESFVLGYLGERSKPISPKEIGDAMNVSSARIATILNQLEEKKMVRRMADPDDGRCTLIELLPDGVLQRRKNAENFNLCAARFLEELGPQDAAEYVRLQSKIADIYTARLACGKKVST